MSLISKNLNDKEQRDRALKFMEVKIIRVPPVAPTEKSQFGITIQICKESESSYRFQIV